MLTLASMFAAPLPPVTVASSPEELLDEVKTLRVQFGIHVFAGKRDDVQHSRVLAKPPTRLADAVLSEEWWMNPWRAKIADRIKHLGEMQVGPHILVSLTEGVTLMALASGMRYTGPVSLAYPLAMIKRIKHEQIGFMIKTEGEGWEQTHDGWQFRAALDWNWVKTLVQTKQEPLPQGWAQIHHDMRGAFSTVSVLTFTLMVCMLEATHFKFLNSMAFHMTAEKYEEAQHSNDTQMIQTPPKTTCGFEEPVLDMLKQAVHLRFAKLSVKGLTELLFSIIRIPQSRSLM